MSMNEGARRPVETPLAPLPIGAYSQAIVSSGLIFVSGQGPFSPGTDLPSGTDVASQTDATLRNIDCILEAAGATMQDVLKVTVFLNDLGDFAEFDRAYGEWFKAEPPARATVGCQLDGFLVELDVIARSPGTR